MQIEEFALATWLNEYETDIEFNLAASTGPLWTAEELLALEGDADPGLVALARLPLNYLHAAGTRELRRAVADSYGGGIDPEWVQVTTGAAEALWLVLFDVCVRGANVIVPHPCYPAFDSIPRALGAEVRYWRLRAQNGFRPDPNELPQLIDRETRAIIVCSPHNPTGMVMEPEQVRTIAELAAARGIRFISDEVYHGIYYDGLERASAAQIPTAVVIGDVSKAFSLAGLRIGWILDRDEFRRRSYYNSRSFISISSSVLSERLAALALRNYRTIWRRNTDLAAHNLRALAALFRAMSGEIGWVEPQGGFTCFPWLKHQTDSKPLCRSLVKEAGVLFAPGYTFGMPAHFRVGFGVTGRRFPEAVGRMQAALQAGVEQ